jgi:hypothetical protein
VSSLTNKQTKKLKKKKIYRSDFGEKQGRGEKAVKLG